MTLSQSQLRLISTIGMGVLVGTALIVIIPEGIETLYSAESSGNSHGRRDLRMQQNMVQVRWVNTGMNTVAQRVEEKLIARRSADDLDPVIANLEFGPTTTTTSSPESAATGHSPGKVGEETTTTTKEHEGDKQGSPTFYIGLSLILGFILMFLIDKLPRHASEKLQPPPATRHISLNNLSQGLGDSGISNGDEESESFLQSLAPTPKQSRSLATTTGLVIHAGADGIAMGASASTTNTKLGFIIFIAIMVHKAPAAFGLTSVLLKQGLSKRAARGHLIVFSLAAPFGALTTWLLVNILGGWNIEGDNGQWWTGMLLLFSGGTFL